MCTMGLTVLMRLSIFQAEWYLKESCKLALWIQWFSCSKDLMRKSREASCFLFPLFVPTSTIFALIETNIYNILQSSFVSQSVSCLFSRLFYVFFFYIFSVLILGEIITVVFKVRLALVAYFCLAHHGVMLCKLFLRNSFLVYHRRT